MSSFLFRRFDEAHPHHFQILPSHAQRVAFAVEETADCFGGTGAVGGVEGGVPLGEPRLQFEEAGEEEGELFGGEAEGLSGIHVVFGEGAGLLGVVPAGPGDDGAGVFGAFGAGVADPALFGHVEFAAEAPPDALFEVAAGVFRRDGDGGK